MLFFSILNLILYKKKYVKGRARLVTLYVVVFCFYTLLLANVVYVLAFVGVPVGFNVSSVKKKRIY